MLKLEPNLAFTTTNGDLCVILSVVFSFMQGEKKMALSRNNRSGTKTGPGGPIMAGDTWSPPTITSPR